MTVAMHEGSRERRAILTGKWSQAAWHDADTRRRCEEGRTVRELTEAMAVEVPDEAFACYDREWR